VKKIAIETDLLRMINKSEVFKDELIGFSIYDPGNDKYLLNINADKYFTPASNTKTFTFFATTNALGDSIPTFAYTRRPDSLIIQPLGDPTFLHPDFSGQNAIQKLLGFDEKVYLIYPETELPTFGPGWAWDDYAYEFQPERNQFPLYGNIVSVNKNGSDQSITPSFFEDFVDFTGVRPSGRLVDQNIFYISKSDEERDTTNWNIPFRTSQELNLQLLSDTLKRKVITIEGEYYLGDTIYNGRSLPLYATMMLRSDNFLAEQMLYMSAVEENKGSIPSYINHLGASDLVFLPDSLVWVDGSGLSRYNMVTPRNQISLYTRIYRSMDWDRIKLIFPNGGETGTIKNWYGAEEPYIFAKTGTLRHNHCLSGFLQTSSGKVLVFSFMNNHFTRPTSEIKSEMQMIFENIRMSY